MINDRGFTKAAMVNGMRIGEASQTGANTILRQSTPTAAWPAVAGLMPRCEIAR